MSAETPEEAYQRGRRELAGDITAILFATQDRYRSLAKDTGDSALARRMMQNHCAGAVGAQSNIAAYLVSLGIPEGDPGGVIDDPETAWGRSLEWFGPSAVGLPGARSGSRTATNHPSNMGEEEKGE